MSRIRKNLTVAERAASNIARDSKESVSRGRAALAADYAAKARNEIAATEASFDDLRATFEKSVKDGKVTPEEIADLKAMLDKLNAALLGD